MLDQIAMMNPFCEAVATLLDGPVGTRSRRVTYLNVVGWHAGQEVVAACQAIVDAEHDAVLLVFDPNDLASGPIRVGVGVDLGETIRLHTGELWQGKDGSVCIVPRGVGKRFGHYVVEQGRVVQRPGWPAADLRAGTERARRQMKRMAAEIVA